MEHNEQEQLRRKALEELLYSLGINPYPAELFEINTNSQYIHDNFEAKGTEIAIRN